MRTTLATLSLTLAATAAAAHPGHVQAVAGHDHWLALGATGAALAVGLLAALGTSRVLRARRAGRAGREERGA